MIIAHRLHTLHMSVSSTGVVQALATCSILVGRQDLQKRQSQQRHGRESRQAQLDRLRSKSQWRVSGPPDRAIGTGTGFDMLALPGDWLARPAYPSSHARYSKRPNFANSW